MLGNQWLELSEPALYKAFDEWLQKAADSKYWSPENPSGNRIPWQSLNEIKQSPITISSPPSPEELRKHSARLQLELPGCYMFGWGSGYEKVVPRYIGQTAKDSLKARLSNRYIPTRRINLHPEDSKIRQCAMATWLTTNGLAGVPEGWKELPSEFDNLILEHYKHHGERRAKAEVRSKIRTGQNHAGIVQYMKDHFLPPLAVRHGQDFAKFGIDDIWFALFPMNDKANIRKLKPILIRTVAEWNHDRGYCPLLNDRHNPYHTPSKN